MNEAPKYDRPWLFLPGDQVLMLNNDTITAGVVQQIRIPGPENPEMIILIQPEEGFAGWWNPERVERIGQ